MKGDRSAPPAAKIFDGRPKEEHRGAPYGRPKNWSDEWAAGAPKMPRGDGGGDRYATESLAIILSGFVCLHYFLSIIPPFFFIFFFIIISSISIFEFFF